MRELRELFLKHRAACIERRLICLLRDKNKKCRNAGKRRKMRLITRAKGAGSRSWSYCPKAESSSLKSARKCCASNLQLSTCTMFNRQKRCCC
jgi:hypothetical protein